MHTAQKDPEKLDISHQPLVVKNQTMYSNWHSFLWNLLYVLFTLKTKAFEGVTINLQPHQLKLVTEPNHVPVSSKRRAQGTGHRADKMQTGIT